MSQFDLEAKAIRQHVTYLSWLLCRERGDFDQLDGRINDGCFAMKGSREDNDLKFAEAELRTLSEAIATRRSQLKANVPMAAE